MSFQFVLFAAGLFLLLQGARYLVEGSVNIARHLKMSKLVIGLTVVAMGTSAPELTVNVISALRGESDLVFANIAGSNILNILLVLGLTALIAHIPIERKIITREFPYLILSAFTLCVLMVDVHTWHVGSLSPLEGVLLLGLFATYMIHIIRESRRINASAQIDKPAGGIFWNAIHITFGLIGLMLGSQLMVDSAVNLATALGVSKGLIGVTIVALGTSLPELTASLMAAYRKETDLAVGNIIGSNIFNTLAILGVSAIAAPAPLVASRASLIDALGALMAVILLAVLLFINNVRQKNHKLSRAEGVVLLAVFAVYLIYIISRG